MNAELKNILKKITEEEYNSFKALDPLPKLSKKEDPTNKDILKELKNQGFKTEQDFLKHLEKQGLIIL